jgi:putative methionine-R-sulfoxide reductase with GAF domain
MHNEVFVKVIDNPNLRRDAQTNAIVDVDSDAYANYQRHKQARLDERARISQLENRINNFESDISDIKSLLTRLLERS